MGYMFGKRGLHTSDSDNAFDLHLRLATEVAKVLRKAEKLKENQYNTDGILNVAMILQHFQPIRESDAVFEYMEKFIPRLEKYIEEENKREWDTLSNKRSHISRYRLLLKNLKRKLQKETEW